MSVSTSELVVRRVLASLVTPNQSEQALDLWRYSYSMRWNNSRILYSYADEVSKLLGLDAGIQLRLISSIALETKRMQRVLATVDPLNVDTTPDALFSTVLGGQAAADPVASELQQYESAIELGQMPKNPHTDLTGSANRASPQQLSFACLLHALLQVVSESSGFTTLRELQTVFAKRRQALPILKVVFNHFHVLNDTDANKDLERALGALKASDDTKDLAKFVNELYVALIELVGPELCDRMFAQAITKAEREPAHANFSVRQFL